VRRGEVGRASHPGSSGKPVESEGSSPSETRRTSSGAGCNTPASAARRKPSRWPNHEDGTWIAGGTAVPKGGNPREWTRSGCTGGEAPSERTTRKVQFGSCAASAEHRSTVGRRGRGAISRRGETGKPVGASLRPLGTSRPGPGGNSQGNRQFHPMCGATCASSRRVRRGLRLAVDRPPGSLLPGAPREPAGTGSDPQPEGARSRDRLREGGATAQTAVGTGRASDERETARRDRDRDWTRPEGAGNVRKVHEGMSRVAAVFSVRDARAILRFGEPPRASRKTAKAEGGAAKPQSCERIGNGRGRRLPWPRL